MSVNLKTLQGLYNKDFYTKIEIDYIPIPSHIKEIHSALITSIRNKLIKLARTKKGQSSNNKKYSNPYAYVDPKLAPIKKKLNKLMTLIHKEKKNQLTKKDTKQIMDIHAEIDEFIRKNTFIGGGCLSDLYINYYHNRNHLINDIDIFCNNKILDLMRIIKVENNLTYVEVEHNIIPGFALEKVQPLKEEEQNLYFQIGKEIFKGKWKDYPVDVIFADFYTSDYSDMFDITLRNFYYQGGETFFGSKEAIKDIKNKVVTNQTLATPLSTFMRIHQFASRYNFHIKKQTENQLVAFLFTVPDAIGKARIFKLLATTSTFGDFAFSLSKLKEVLEEKINNQISRLNASLISYDVNIDENKETVEIIKNDINYHKNVLGEIEADFSPLSEHKEFIEQFQENDKRTAFEWIEELLFLALKSTLNYNPQLEKIYRNSIRQGLKHIANYLESSNRHYKTSLSLNHFVNFAIWLYPDEHLAYGPNREIISFLLEKPNIFFNKPFSKYYYEILINNAEFDDKNFFKENSINELVLTATKEEKNKNDIEELIKNSQLMDILFAEDPLTLDELEFIFPGLTDKVQTTDYFEQDVFERNFRYYMVRELFKNSSDNLEKIVDKLESFIFPGNKKFDPFQFNFFQQNNSKYITFTFEPKHILEGVLSNTIKIGFQRIEFSVDGPVLQGEVLYEDFGRFEQIMNRREVKENRYIKWTLNDTTKNISGTEFLFFNGKRKDRIKELINNVNIT